ncbi:hypothetical protein GCM10009799_30760 [Nocardiopsis rhodophaea]|uniref:DUF1023 domain-containing protein n=1 Tax=Nocardiopsis rhodophaea TaxID=280238 RepID=A0ABN2T866_9ACTN
MSKFEFNETGCTFLPDMTLAKEGKLREFASDFEKFMERITGRSGNLHDGFNSSSHEFDDLIAWKIKDEAQYDQSKWQESTMAISFLIATTLEWADAVEEYKNKREINIERWKNSEKQHLETIRKARENDLPAGLYSAPYTTKSNPWIPSLDQALKAMRNDFDEQRDAAKKDWSKFQEKADEISDKLKNGATEENVRKLQESGYLSWAPFNIMGGKYDKPELPTLKGGVPKQGSDPKQVNAWWGSLTPSQRKSAMAKHADKLRMMDGIPVGVRNKLNRDHLDQVLPYVKEEYGEDSDEYRELKKLKNKTLDAEGTDRYLLGLDTTDGHGRAIVADGNPDTADNVATLVPGTGTEWRAVNGQLGRAEAIKKEAQTVDPNSEHAVISWIGYDAPGVGGALLEDDAVTGATELHNFQSGLRATHQGDHSNNTVIGHSYGSTVIGHALQGPGIDADNYVFVGSPGVNADHVSDLGVPGSKVHASTAENDGIRDFTPDAIHGPEPTSKEFGATVFESDTGREGGTFPFGDAHSDYFREDNESVAYMGEVVAGKR